MELIGREAGDLWGAGMGGEMGCFRDVWYKKMWVICVNNAGGTPSRMT